MITSHNAISFTQVIGNGFESESKIAYLDCRIVVLEPDPIVDLKLTMHITNERNRRHLHTSMVGIIAGIKRTVNLKR